jgi:cleavage stimulation factor subunit 3
MGNSTNHFVVSFLQDVFVAAALMEYYCTKDAKIAGNIFELGFKKFKTNADYILEYLDFLSHLNEANNTR